MAKTVDVGSVWYIVSMSWIAKWQDFVGFDKTDGEDDVEDLKGAHPGKIDNSDIIEPFYLSQFNQPISTVLEERSPKYSHMNV
jgi:hypothetical protein